MSDSFLHPEGSQREKPSGYFLTLAVVLFSYVLIGQLPLLIGLSMQEGGLSAYDGVDLHQLAEVLGKNTILVYLILPFVFAFIALLLSVRFIHKRSFLSVFTIRKHFDWKRFFTTFLIWGIILSVFLYLTTQFTGKVFWNFNSKSFIPLLAISLLLIPLQTTCEELLFRGYLMQSSAKFLPKGWMVVLFTGMLFGLVHGANPEVETLGYSVLTYYIMTGVFLGLLTVFDDGIELSMGYHAINNIFSALIITNDWQAFQTDALFKDYNPPSFGWESIITIALLQPAIIYLFAKVYNWKDIRRKLF
jgi:membrane protease YdiL (CAAX protease family)